MASVNLTCATCGARSLCERCRSIARDVRAAGHSVTTTSRYDALRAATIGAYGFDACILTVTREEPSIIDAATALLTRIRVGLVADRSTTAGRSLPQSFSVIDAALIGKTPFPTEWIVAAPASIGDEELTRRVVLPRQEQADATRAQRRLKTLARRAQRELGAVGFSGEPRLDLVAMLEDEIAWAAASDTTFGILLLHVEHRDRATPMEMEDVLRHFGSSLRRFLRSGDAIAQSTDTLMAVITEATPDGMTRVVKRVRKMLRAAQKEPSQEKDLAVLFEHVTLGTASFPLHGTTRVALLARATAAATVI